MLAHVSRPSKERSGTLEHGFRHFTRGTNCQISKVSSGPTRHLPTTQTTDLANRPSPNNVYATHSAHTMHICSRNAIISHLCEHSHLHSIVNAWLTTHGICISCPKHIRPSADIPPRSLWLERCLSCYHRRSWMNVPSPRYACDIACANACSTTGNRLALRFGEPRSPHAIAPRATLASQAGYCPYPFVIR